MASPELLEWCRQGGVIWNGIEAGFVAEGWRGVLATTELLPGACILRVPRRLLMSVESARQDPAMAAALQQCSGGPTLTSEQVLAAHLLLEVSKGPASFWHPYMRSLPPTYTTAMCFTESEAAELQLPAAVAAVCGATAAAAAQHASVLPLLRALSLAAKWRSRGAWLWAASTLSSRTMYLPGDTAGALTPFGDLHNYRPPPPPYAPTLAVLVAAARQVAAAEAGGEGTGGAAGAAAAGSADTKPAAAATTTAAAAAAAAAARSYAGIEEAAPAASGEGAAAAETAATIAGDGCLDEDADEYCIYARTEYAPGEQVFLCYGRHTNLELLQHYGFVLPDNPHDTVGLPPHLLPPAVAQQLTEQGSCGWGGNSGGFNDASSSSLAQQPAAWLHASGAPSWELLRTLRLGCASVAERTAGAWRALADRPISAGSESAAFRALLAACEGALAALPSTVEEDEARLKELRGLAAGQPAIQGQDGGQQEQRQQDTQREQQRQQHQQQAVGEGSASSGSGSSQWGAEKLCVAVEWRLGHKRTLQRGVAICHAVLAALPAALQQRGGTAGIADITARLAALQRKPRW